MSRSFDRALSSATLLSMFFCKSVFHRGFTLHNSCPFFHQISVLSFFYMLTGHKWHVLGSNCLVIFICSCANYNSCSAQNDASSDFLFSLHVFSNIVRHFYIIFSPKWITLDIGWKSNHQKGDPVQWQANANRNFEKYRSRDTGDPPGAKVDKLVAPKWTNWWRS